MKHIKKYIKIVLQFVFIYVIFNLINTILQMILVNMLGGNINFIETYAEALKNNSLLYLILYIAIFTIYSLYNRYIVKTLNTKLNEVLKGGDFNEK